MQRRQPLVDKALELDPLSGEAHIARAYLSFHQQLKTGKDYDQEESILKAVELSRNYAEAHRWYSGLLSDKGLLEEALVFAAILHAYGELRRRDVLLLAMEDRIALLNELEADIRKQCQWYEQHKHDPLF